MTEKTIPVYFHIESFEPDSIQYKPAKPHILPINLYVRLDVPEKYFVDNPDVPKGGKCLTERGFSKIRRVLDGTEKF